MHCALGIMQCQQYSIKSKKAIKLYQEAKSAQYPSDKIALLNQAIAKEPQFTEAYWELSRIYIALDTIEAAIGTLEIANQLNTPMVPGPFLEVNWDSRVARPTSPIA